MEELEVKSMLADERIPAQYKLGGRLSSEFLDGVDYAEQHIMENSVEAWLARDKDGTLCAYPTRPFLYRSNGTWEYDETTESAGSTLSGFVLIERDLFPEVTFENSPKKAIIKTRIILED